MMDIGTLAQARRFYHHVYHGGQLKLEDVSYMVSALEEAYNNIVVPNEDKIEEIIIRDLTRNLKDFRQDLEKEDFRCFSIDEEEGRLECEKHIKAFELVLDFYGG